MTFLKIITAELKTVTSAVSIEKLIQLSEILNITPDYILTGKMLNNKSSDFAEKYDKFSIKQKQYINQQIDCLKKIDLK